MHWKLQKKAKIRHSKKNIITLKRVFTSENEKACLKVQPYFLKAVAKLWKKYDFIYVDNLQTDMHREAFLKLSLNWKEF